MKERYADAPFQVISVHTPEFDYEKERARVERAAERFGLEQPIYMDNDYAYWNALGNRYWPAFYLVDKQGRIRKQVAGEMHAGTDRAAAFEALIDELLAAPR